MKVVFCTQRFILPLVGGVDVYTDRLSQALKRLGHEISLIALDWTASVEDESITVSHDEYDDIKIWRLEFALAKRPKQSFDYAYDPEMGQIIKDILQEQNPDLFIIMNFYTVTLASVEAAKELGVPVVHIATDFLPICRRNTFIRWDGRSCQVGETIQSCAECFVSHRSLGRLAASGLKKLPEETVTRWANNHESYGIFHPFWILKPYLKQAAITEQRLKILHPLREKIDLILTPTQYTLKMYLENGFNEEQLHFVPFAVEADDPLSKIEYRPTSHIRFLFVGRFQPYKGAHLLVEAFNNLESPKGATLTIYGTPDLNGYSNYYDHLKAQIATNSRIRLAGQIAPTDLAKAFADTDYFVLPSTWHENSPLILLDALQAKSPVIASDIGGVTDVVKDGENGFLFPMGNVRALQQVMQRVIDQPDLVRQLQSGAKLPTIDDYAQILLQQCQERRILPEFVGSEA